MEVQRQLPSAFQPHTVAYKSDFAQACRISEVNYLGEFTPNSFTPYMGASPIHEKPVKTAENKRTVYGEFSVLNRIGKGSYGSCYKSTYRNAVGKLLSLVIKIQVVEGSEMLNPANLTRNLIPTAINAESFTQQQFSPVDGVVYAFHSAELTCDYHSRTAMQWIATKLFDGDSSAFRPQNGDRMFLLCLPLYDYDLHTCLEYESQFLHNTLQLGGNSAKVRQPPRGELYLTLSILRFYRLERVLSIMHANSHGHFDVKPGNILMRSTQDQSSTDLCDFGLTRYFEDKPFLVSADVPTCYPPELTTHGGGVPPRRHLNNDDACREAYIAYDYYCLGTTLFEMLQAYFTPPDQHLQVGVWSESPLWLLRCHRRIENYPTSRVIKDFALAFLQRDPTERYKQGFQMKLTYPTAAALWNAHNAELARSHQLPAAISRALANLNLAPAVPLPQRIRALPPLPLPSTLLGRSTPPLGNNPRNLPLRSGEQTLPGFPQQQRRINPTNLYDYPATGFAGNRRPPSGPSNFPYN